MINELKSLRRSRIPPKTKIIRPAATEDEKLQVVEMFEYGMNITTISEKTGFAVSTIKKWCSEGKIKSKKKDKVDNDDVKLAKELYNSGMDIPLIASTLGVTELKVEMWIAKYKWKD